MKTNANKFLAKFVVFAIVQILNKCHLSKEDICVDDEITRAAGRIGYDATVGGQFVHTFYRQREECLRALNGGETSRSFTLGGGQLWSCKYGKSNKK